MINKAYIKLTVLPLLLGGIFTEVATNHHPEPHGNRSERMEQITRRYQEFSHRSVLVQVPGGGRGGNPEPVPAEDILNREIRVRRNSGPSAEL